MIEPQTFEPPRLPGILFQGAAVLLLVSASIFSIWQASISTASPFLFLYLLPLLAAFAVIPFLLYRIQALRKSGYTLERDGIHIQWGLRRETIPMDKVLWVRGSAEYSGAIPLPVLRWPGSVFGTRSSPEGIPFEFMASRSSALVLIASTDTIYTISPQEPQAFLEAYRRLTELGSLSPVQPVSFHPSFLIGRFWSDRPARFLMLAGALLSLLLFAWVLWIIPERPQVLLRAGVPGAGMVPSMRLLLLPFLSSIFFGGDLLLGLYLYRRAETRANRREVDSAFAYMLWGSGVLTPLLFIAAVIFILSSA
jgi:hypothetical protein